MSYNEPDSYDEREPDPEELDPEPEPELVAHWDAADEGDAQFTAQFEAREDAGKHPDFAQHLLDLGLTLNRLQIEMYRVARNKEVA